jgi:hypothetical protein
MDNSGTGERKREKAGERGRERETTGERARETESFVCKRLKVVCEKTKD